MINKKEMLEVIRKKTIKRGQFLDKNYTTSTRNRSQLKKNL